MRLRRARVECGHTCRRRRNSHPAAGLNSRSHTAFSVDGRRVRGWVATARSLLQQPVQDADMSSYEAVRSILANISVACTCPPVRELIMASIVQGIAIRAAVVLAFIGLAAAGATAAANADPPPPPPPANAAPPAPPPPAEDPICHVFPHLERCIGSPQGLADNPSDAGCAFDPGDASCSADKLFGPAPGAIPALPGPSMPPPIGSDLPGSMNANGTPYGSAPMGIPGMGMPGMPGSIP